MRVRQFASFVVAMGLVLSASARDTTVARMHEVDGKMAEALKKAKLPATKLVREHFAGWTASKIKQWAKSKRLDQDGFLKLVHQAELLASPPLSPAWAHLLVTQCNVQGLAAFASQRAEGLQPCVAKHAAAYGAKETPTTDEIQTWIDGAKAAGQATETLSWANKVIIGRFHNPNPDVVKVLKKKKWSDNLVIHENLHLSGNRDKFAKANRLDPEEVQRYAAYADLLRLKNVTPRLAHLLYVADVRSLGQLKSRRAPELTVKLAEANRQQKLLPNDLTEAEVGALIDAATPFQQH